jgi:hypothetical protein
MVMKKNETGEKAIRQKLYDLRLQTRERYLELKGVDVKRLRELERDIDSEFGELVASLHDQRRQEGKERAETHKKILAMSQASLSSDAEKALHADLSTQTSILDHLAIATIDPSKLVSAWWCHCHYTSWLFNNLGHGDVITIDPPSGGTGIATVTYDTSLNQAQPYADARGGGTGTINTAQVRTWYKFAFTPITDGTYCIRPMVFMNGWWLLWTWGACGGTSEDLGIGTVQVMLRVRVDQLSTTVKEIEHTVLDQNLSGGSNDEGAVDYVSDRDGGASMTVSLQGGHEAVVFIECEVYTQMINHGRAIVDMQSSSGFYFQVPLVAIGRRHCHWPFIYEAIPMKAVLST